MASPASSTNPDTTSAKTKPRKTSRERAIAISEQIVAKLEELQSIPGLKAAQVASLDNQLRGRVDTALEAMEQRAESPKFSLPE